MRYESSEEYVAPRIEIVSVAAEFTNISEEGPAGSSIDPVWINEFEDIL